jgi:hypothetical protein
MFRFVVDRWQTPTPCVHALNAAPLPLPEEREVVLHDSVAARASTPKVSGRGWGVCREALAVLT